MTQRASLRRKPATAAQRALSAPPMAQLPQSDRSRMVIRRIHSTRLSRSDLARVMQYFAVLYPKDMVDALDLVDADRAERQRQARNAIIERAKERRRQKKENAPGGGVDTHDPGAHSLSAKTI